MVEQSHGELKNKLRRDNDVSLLNNNMDLYVVRNKLEQFREAVLQDVERRISCMIEEVMQEVRHKQLQTTEFRDFAQSSSPESLRQANATWNNRHGKIQADTADSAEEKTGAQHQHDEPKKRSAASALPEKIFVTRESYLTALLEVDHMKSINHIFYSIFLVFMLYSICYDLFVMGRLTLGINTFRTGFAKIDKVFVIWVLQHLFVFALFYAFRSWAALQHKIAEKPFMRQILNYSCLITYAVFQLLFGCIACGLCLRLDLPYVTSSVLLLESTRLMMKMHAFVRTNCTRVWQGKLKAEDTSTSKSVLLPSFHRYLYFLFAPTLIYRDNYPRTTRIRWKFALARLMEVVAIAFLYSYIHEHYIKVYYGNFGLEELNASQVIVKIFGMMMPSVVIFLCGFYLLLHAWLNFCAELLRFGDRMFYKDWWTAWTYDAYYRNWNVVVHDWLYEYIYKDVYMHLFSRSKVAASLTVFIVSALVHELVIAFALQVFFPVMFIFFGVIGVTLVFITRRAPKTMGNIILWFSLVTGNGLLYSLYCMEYYARYNCPKDYNRWLDYLLPAIWNCYQRTL